jgi:RNA polymerase sigma-70 factor (ECF subfamily)
MTHWDDNEVEREIPVLRRYARALTRDETAADDLVQEALVRAMERVDTFQRGRSLKTWLLAIVHNQFVTGIRRQRAEERRDAAFALTQLDQLSRLDQETMLYLQQVGDLYARLPEHHRVVLHLIVVEGLSYQEAADTLQIAVGTVMSRLSRARAALRAAAENTRDAPGLHIVGGLDAS